MAATKLSYVEMVEMVADFDDQLDNLINEWNMTEPDSFEQRAIEEEIVTMVRDRAIVRALLEAEARYTLE
jgi:hypothetical protein